jgi:hypothetical protein
MDKAGHLPTSLGELGIMRKAHKASQLLLGDQVLERAGREVAQVVEDVGWSSRRSMSCVTRGFVNPYRRAIQVRVGASPLSRSRWNSSASWRCPTTGGSFNS